MEHFSRLLLWKFGQESTSRTGSMFRRQVDRTSSGGRCWHRAQKRIRGATRRCYGTGSPVKMVARSGHEIPRLPVWGRLACQGRRSWRASVFQHFEISNDVWRKMNVKNGIFSDEGKNSIFDGWNENEIGFTLNIVL